MPSIYTHHIFGKEVFSRLPKDIQMNIKNYETLYKIGLQGPDFLFFYRPFYKNKINATGHNIHKEQGLKYFNTVSHVFTQYNINSPEYVYLLGFICHFILDSECHGYVYQNIKELNFNHLEMEIEFDRYRMEKNHIKPLSYKIYNMVPTDDFTVTALSHIYKNIPQKKIKSSLKSMRFYKKLFYTPNFVKHFFIRLGMRLTFQYEKIQGHMLKYTPDRKANITNKGLEELYQNAIDHAVDLIKTFYNAYPSIPLTNRLMTNFKNNIINK